jgi:ABC-type nitrate/sulfonate/bicarbonate transport system substrate-binding protein
MASFDGFAPVGATPFFVGWTRRMTGNTETHWTQGVIEHRAIKLGFVPLVDSGPLLIAQERGFFARYGLDVELSREPSWANVRDKVAVGALDGAHMLAAMPLAATLGLGTPAMPMIVPAVLNLNGNAITVSNALWEQMAQASDDAMQAPASALRRVVDRRRAMGAPPLVFAAVFSYSSHNYLLRFWFANAGIDPDRDVRIVVVPPPLMPANLSARHIDGFCVGEPWNQRIVDLCAGRIVASTSEIWGSHPEKVFAVSESWADRHPNTLRAVVAAIVEAARWMDEPGNRREAARVLARRDYVNAPEEIIAAAMAGRPRFAPDGAALDRPDYIVFHRYAANFPWRSQAEWTLGQMRRWGQIADTVDIAALAARVYRPDLYREVACTLGAPCPSGDRKTEGLRLDRWVLDRASQPMVMGPDALCDGRAFDAQDIAAYIAAQTNDAADKNIDLMGTERRADIQARSPS